MLKIFELKLLERLPVKYLNFCKFFTQILGKIFCYKNHQWGIFFNPVPSLVHSDVSNDYHLVPYIYAFVKLSVPGLNSSKVDACRTCCKLQ